MPNNSPNHQKESEKAEVEDYFNGKGFERWNRIYSESEEVNNVQRNIRIGHQKTVDLALSWVKGLNNINQMRFCDAGCGVGTLAIPLSEMGAKSIDVSDISEAMILETKKRASIANINMKSINFRVCDLESLEGSFDVVICLDVFIHYQQDAAEEMVRHLCSLSNQRLIVSFAPYTILLALLKRIGQFFPGPSKTTRAYTLSERGIIETARKCGFIPVRDKLITAPFYFSKIIEFTKK